MKPLFYSLAVALVWPLLMAGLLLGGLVCLVLLCAVLLVALLGLTGLGLIFWPVLPCIAFYNRTHDTKDPLLRATEEWCASNNN